MLLGVVDFSSSGGDGVVVPGLLGLVDEDSPRSMSLLVGRRAVYLPPALSFSIFRGKRRDLTNKAAMIHFTLGVSTFSVSLCK